MSQEEEGDGFAVVLGGSKKKKKAKPKGKRHKAQKDKGNNPDGPVLTAGWKAKCRKDKAWCDKYLVKFIVTQQTDRLFEGKRRSEALPKAKYRDAIYDKCEHQAGFRKRADWEHRTDKRMQKVFECIEKNFIYVDLFGEEHAKKMTQRGGKLSVAESSGSLTVWLILGAMLLLVFASIGAYFALLRGKKGKDTLGKGSTKLGKLKSRRSGKSSKGVRMSSRKSAKQSTKKSVSGNSRPSPGRGTKKSANKK